MMINKNPVNKKATNEARKLLEYLYSVSGKGIITGQHTQTNPCEEISYIKDITGKEPKLRGFELLSYSPNINYNDASNECIIEVEENKGTMETALKWAIETDGIVALSFHWFSPIGGRDKSFYAEHTNFDASKILEPNSQERKSFYSDLDAIAIQLKKFQKAKIPVLWRPFHEADGKWFWWGAKGDIVGRELFKLCFNHYVNVHHLDNLLWIWNSPVKEGYPGDAYVDIISRDVYLPEKYPTDYEKEYLELINNTTKNKVVALAEVGYMPDINILKQSKVPWAYYMTWSKEFCIGEKYNSINDLKNMYSSDYAITL